MKTLVILSHPDFENSRANKSLCEVAKNLGGVEVRHLEALYGNDCRGFDVKLEQEKLKNADRIVFQFPFYWLSCPPMLKAYVDAVLTRGFAYGENSFLLEGKKFSIAITTGSTLEEVYSKDGVSGHEIDDFLLPFMATAGYCKMIYSGKFVFDGVFSSYDSKIEAKKAEFIKFLG